MRVLSALTASVPRTILVVVALAAIVIALAVRPLGLTIAGAMGLYFVVWWTVLFAILPIRVGAQGVEPEGEPVVGADAGAPAIPALREKAIWTTLASDAVFLIVCATLPLAGL